MIRFALALALVALSGCASGPDWEGLGARAIRLAGTSPAQGSGGGGGGGGGESLDATLTIGANTAQAITATGANIFGASGVTTTFTGAATNATILDGAFSGSSVTASTWLDAGGNGSGLGTGDLYASDATRTLSWDASTGILLADRGSGSSIEYTTSGQWVVRKQDSGTNDTPAVGTWTRTTSGTPTAGFGMRVEFAAEHASGSNAAQAALYTAWTDATAVSATADLRLSTRGSGTLTERLRLTGAGGVTIGAVGTLGGADLGDLLVGDGTNSMQFDASADTLTITGSVLATGGTVGAPGFVVEGVDTGVFSPSANRVALSAGGVEILDAGAARVEFNAPILLSDDEYIGLGGAYDTKVSGELTALGAETAVEVLSVVTANGDYAGIKIDFVIRADDGSSASVETGTVHISIVDLAGGVTASTPLVASSIVDTGSSTLTAGVWTVTATDDQSIEINVASVVTGITQTTHEISWKATYSGNVSVTVP